jgi:GT2 family glycosyltransferase/glycosyltransferase involved in cell wall biosynthesis
LIDGREIPNALELARSLFDPLWYQSDPGWLDDPFDRYIAMGARAGGDPHPLFSTEYYLRRIPELVERDESPLLHYVREGWRNGLSPHPLFDTTYYVRRYGGTLERGEDPLNHYLRKGAAAGCQPSPWFDSKYYLRAYPDVADSGLNPLVHYVVFGGHEGRRPHDEFDSALHTRLRRLPATANPLVDFLRRQKTACQVRALPTKPEFSIVVLNFNKPLMTVQAVVEILSDENLRERAEVIVVDNGSRAANYSLLRAELPPSARLFRLDVNRFFGEGNNLGAELARGEYLVFLNNDAFLTTGSLDALRATFDRHPDCGAVGPRFLYPDGRVQEAGAMMSACGIALQRGKFLLPSVDLYNKTEPVDYVSAACIMLPLETFDAIGGFDLAWDPAYYEDSDLGLKVRMLGKRVYYCADANVVHIENTTSGDAGLALRMDGIVEVNREKFVSRWSRYLAGGRDPALGIELPSRAHRAQTRPLAVLYTPYPLYPGGGERYLLTIAESLADRYDVLLATPELYSLWRVRTLARELRLDLSHVTPIAARELERHLDCEVFVAMGNEFYPPIRAQGRRAFYHCQFPFSMSADHVSNGTRLLAGYEAIIVNSAFTARHYQAEAARYGEAPPPVRVVAPPVPLVAEGPECQVPGRILNVGRFSPTAHNKRQDVLLEAFRELVNERPGVELHLAGTVPSHAAARDFVIELRRTAIDLPVTFHLNVAPHQLDALYRSSSTYWHATGFGKPPELMPEFHEHFGISVVEAMSAGAYPLAIRGGGPPEYIDPPLTGGLWETVPQLVDLTLDALDLAPAERLRRSEAARAAAARFDVPFFHENIIALLDCTVPAAGVPESIHVGSNGTRVGAVSVEGEG